MIEKVTEWAPQLGLVLIVGLGVFAIYFYRRFLEANKLVEDFMQEAMKARDSATTADLALEEGRKQWSKDKNSLEDRLRSDTALMNAAAERLEKYKAGLDTNQKLLFSQAMVNEDLNKEKGEAWAMQQHQAILYGNGQSVLLNRFQRLMGEYNRYRAEKGDPPAELPQDVKQIMDQAEAS